MEWLQGFSLSGVLTTPTRTAQPYRLFLAKISRCFNSATSVLSSGEFSSLIHILFEPGMEIEFNILDLHDNSSNEHDDVG